MYRRCFLASVPLCALTGGCLESVESPEANTTVASDSRRAGAFTASIVRIRSIHSTETGPVPTDNQGNFVPMVSADFDCTENDVSITGWMATSSCRIVSIHALAYEDSADRILLTLTDSWDQPGDPQDIDCAGIAYRYEILVESQEELPEELRIVYMLQKSDSGRRFSVENDQC